MDLPVVHLKPEVFFELTRTSVETFKKECIGFVYGRSPTRDHNRFLVTHLGPFQCVSNRSNTEIGESTGKKRMEQFFTKVPLRFNPIGLFHSHASWGKRKPQAAFSSVDEEDMIKSQTRLELLVAISSRKKGKSVWQSLPDGDIRGSLGGYDFEIAAYTLVSDCDGSHPEKITIIAPEAMRLINRALGGSK